MLTESIRDELVKVFTVPQAEVLAPCVVKARDTLSTRFDRHELPTALADLATEQTLTRAGHRELPEQKKMTSAAIEEIKQTFADIAGTFADIASELQSIDVSTAQTAECALEWVVGNRLPAYVGSLIRRCRVVGVMDVVESLENSPAVGELTADDLDQLSRADLIATGTIDGEALYLVGEVSFTADNDDVLRATRRAAVLTKAGERSQPFVACDAISPISAELARREGVWVIVKGRLVTPAA
jgi:hypothetical protein